MTEKEVVPEVCHKQIEIDPLTDVIGEGGKWQYTIYAIFVCKFTILNSIIFTTFQFPQFWVQIPIQKSWSNLLAGFFFFGITK